MKVYLDMFIAWFKIGILTFGGGYAMLPMIQKEVIEKHNWATEDEIMNYYAVGQCTPGVIAVNTATFVGYKLKGILGGIACTLGVVSPSLIIISIIATLISNFSELEIVQNALSGIQVAVCVLMFMAITKLYKTGVKDVAGFIIMALAFVLAYFTNISTVILVICAGVIGYVLTVIKKGEKA